jgi:hypothetical protein
MEPKGETPESTQQKMIIEGELTPFLNNLLSLIFDDEEGS